MSENNAKGIFKEAILSNEFLLMEFVNDTNESQYFEREVDSSYIQLHFCLRGDAKLLFNNGNYVFEVLNQYSVLLYNPQQDLPINLELSSNSILISLLVSIKTFHSLFSEVANYISFLSEENRSKKFYDNTIIKPQVLMILQQITTINIKSSIRSLYLKGKIYELLSLYFQKDAENSGDYCPFLVDERDVAKIKKAKEIVVSRMSEPPSLQEIANEIGLNLKKLKEGFKQIYGNTVFGFLFDYKMEYARKLLESKQYNVNEVGMKVGYSTASHFIAAYKKKFGITPKQYVLGFKS